MDFALGVRRWWMPKAQTSANTIADDRIANLARFDLSTPFMSVSHTQRKSKVSAVPATSVLDLCDLLGGMVDTSLLN
jgi:hypothetical protein